MTRELKYVGNMSCGGMNATITSATSFLPGGVHSADAKAHGCRPAHGRVGRPSGSAATANSNTGSAYKRTPRVRMPAAERDVNAVWRFHADCGLQVPSITEVKGPGSTRRHEDFHTCCDRMFPYFAPQRFLLVRGWLHPRA